MSGMLAMQWLPWAVALVALVLCLSGLAIWAWTLRRAGRVAALPTEWALSARPVFSTDERRIYRLLREALPHHIVLSKLPLVRFCQPTDPNDVRYWYDLLGNNNVAFAVCSSNGRVLAAIDLDTDRGNSRRVLQIKQSVLGACRIRYLRCPVDHLPSVAELQLLVPHGSAASRGPPPAPAIPQPMKARGSPGSAQPRRGARAVLWQDATAFQDSFFAPDTRADGFGNSGFGSLAGEPVDRSGSDPASRRNLGSGAEPDDIAGVVVDTPRYSGQSRH